MTKNMNLSFNNINYLLLTIGLCITMTYGQYQSAPHIIIMMVDDLVSDKIYLI